MRFPAFFPVFVALACVAPSAALAAESQTVGSFEKTLTKKVGYTFLLSLPEGYAADPAKQWPLLVKPLNS